MCETAYKCWLNNGGDTPYRYAGEVTVTTTEYNDQGMVVKVTVDVTPK